MAKGRAAFLAEFGHREEDHRRRDAEHGVDQEMITASIRASIASLDYLRLDRCGWWWCHESDPALVPWEELTKALRLLRDRGIEPTSREVAQLANAYQGLSDLAAERDDWERLDAALRGLKLTRLAGSPEVLRREFLAKVEPWTKRAFQIRPARGAKGGASVKQHHREVVRTAIEHGWDADIAAAALFLVGVEPKGDSRRNVDFRKLKGLWQKRWKASTAPPAVPARHPPKKRFVSA